MSLAAETAVQEELQQYLAEKGVNSLFVKVVEQLLMEKPDSPARFMVQYLLDNFPEETKDFGRVDAESKQRDPEPARASARDAEEAAPHADNGAAKPAPARDDPVAEEDLEEAATAQSEASSDEDEDNEDDYVDELPQPKYRSNDGKPSRRVSVSAGVIDMSGTTETPKFPKSEEDRVTLRNIIKDNVLCAHLDAPDVERLVDAMEKVHFAADTDIIEQGDKTAEHYYILASGAATVYKDGAKLDFSYAPGEGFGELALMYNAPRAATIRTLEACDVWRLDQVSFKVVVMGSAIKKRNKVQGFLQQVPILAEMADNERMVLADALRERTFARGETIVEQGSAGDEFYIVAEGQVKVEKDGHFVSTLAAGEYFGEIALLTSKSRQATVTADADEVKTLTVHRKVFQRVLGPLSDILSRNMAAYENWMKKE